MRNALHASIFMLALVAAGGCAGLGSHDVELTIVAPAMVTDAALASVRAVEIGAGTGAHGASMSYPLSRPMSRSERVVIHASSDHGSLAVGVIAYDAGGAIVALGSAAAPLDGSGPQKLVISIDPPAGDGAIVHVTPPAYTLFSGQAITFLTDSSVRWSVQEGDAGGTIDTSGRYTAPAAAGSYHVLAASTAYFGHTVTVTVDVLTSGVAPYIGALGGGGFRDGVRGVGRLSAAHGATTDGKTVYFTTQDKLVRAVDIASGTLSTIAGVLDQPAPVDGVGPAAHFGDPKQIVSDGIGNLYVADGANAAIRKIVLATGAVTTFAGKLGMPGYVDGAPGTAQLSYPVGLVSDGAGTLYVADDSNCSIRKIDIATQVVTTIAGSPPSGGPQCGVADGSGAAARFAHPGNAAWDGAGHLYVDDLDDGDLRRIDVASGAVTTVAKAHHGQIAWDGQAVWVIQGNLTRIDPNGTATVFKDPNSRVGNSFYFPSTDALIFGPDGTFYVFTDDALVTFDTATARQTVVAGAPSTVGTTSVYGDRAQSRLFGLNSFTLGQDGLLYGKAFDGFFKADPTSGQVTLIPTDGSASACCAAMVSDGSGNLWGTGFDQTVRRISIGSGTSVLVAGNPGFPGYKDGAGATAQFAYPADIALDGIGNVYVADSANAVIRKIVAASGDVSLFAGIANNPGFKDGTGGAAQLNFPRGLVYDGAGALYLADANNNRIRKITVPGAIVTTLSGSGMTGTSDGTAAAASFYSPQTLVFDASRQNLYVADTLNNLVRRVSVVSGAVTTIAGTVGLSVDQPGALPAIVNQPGALRLLPSGELLVATQREASILQIRLP